MLRCGTHLLETALQSHSDVACYGEVFNPYSRIHGYPVDRPTVAEVIEHCRTQTLATGFLAHAFVGLAAEETGPGLDLAYRAQPVVRAARGLWQAIPPSTPVITLRRHNLLARYVSERVARRHSVWCVRKGERMPDPERLALDCDDMLLDFARTAGLMEIAAGRFPGALAVHYEELVAEPEATFDRVLLHLGVAPRRLIPGTLKVGRALADTISNFDEVRTRLLGTRFAAFLEMPT
ncbi:MAG: sulfotransferase [Vicinamibacteria bacterium]